MGIRLPFSAAADVIAVPCYASRDVGIDATNGQERASILNLNVFRCDEHCEASHCKQAEANHKDASLLIPIGEEAPWKVTLVTNSHGISGTGRTPNCEKTANDIWRYGHQLGLIVFIPQAFDDSR